MLKINKSSPVPIYYQISSYFAEEIKNGNVLPEEKLPSESEIGNALNISRMTARQAINELVKSGFAYRVKGKGTFVCKPRIERQHQKLRGFFEDMKAKNLEPHAQVLEFSEADPTVEVQRALNISFEEKCFKMERIKFTNNEPIGIETMYIVKKYCPDLLNYYRGTGRLFETLENKFHLEIDHAEEKVKATKATKSQAKYLGLSACSLLLHINRVVYLKNGQPILFVNTLFNNDRYSYQTILYR
ncbi:MAG: GntR family transcriptional regulator [Dehalobacterium sp.]